MDSIMKEGQGEAGAGRNFPRLWAALESPAIVSREGSVSPTWMQIILWGGLVGLGMFLVGRGFAAFQLGIYRDDAIYTILSHSFLYADHFGVESFTGHAVDATYPFGFPMVLALVGLLLPARLEALKFVSLLATFLNATILFWGWKRFSQNRSFWWGLAVSGLYILSPVVIGHAAMVMSEAVFTLFCLSSILLAERAARDALSWWWAPAMGVMLFMTIFTRTVGFVLLIGLFVYLLKVKGLRFWRSLAFVSLWMAVFLWAVVAFTPVGWDNLLPTRYLQDHNASDIAVPLADDGASPGQTQERAQYDISQLFYDYIIDGSIYHAGLDYRQILFPLGNGEHEAAIARRIGLPYLPYLIGFGFTLTMLLGFFQIIRRREVTLFVLFGFLYLGLLQIWVWNGPRLLYPIAPQMFFALLLGVEALLLAGTALIGFKSRVPWGRYVLPLVVLGLLSVSFYRSLDVEDSRLHVGDLSARTAWIRTNTPQDAVLLTETTEVDYLYSGRKTIPYPAGIHSTGELEEYLKSNEVAFILVAPHIAWQEVYTPVPSQLGVEMKSLLKSLLAVGDAEPVYSDPGIGVQIYQFTP